MTILEGSPNRYALTSVMLESAYETDAEFHTIPEPEPVSGLGVVDGEGLVLGVGVAEADGLGVVLAVGTVVLLFLILITELPLETVWVKVMAFE